MQITLLRTVKQRALPLCLVSHLLGCVALSHVTGISNRVEVVALGNPVERAGQPERLPAKEAATLWSQFSLSNAPQKKRPDIKGGFLDDPFSLVEGRFLADQFQLDLEFVDSGWKLRGASVGCPTLERRQRKSYQIYDRVFDRRKTNIINLFGAYFVNTFPFATLPAMLYAYGQTMKLRQAVPGSAEAMPYQDTGDTFAEETEVRRNLAVMVGLLPWAFYAGDAFYLARNTERVAKELPSKYTIKTSAPCRKGEQIQARVTAVRLQVEKAASVSYGFKQPPVSLSGSTAPNFRLAVKDAEKVSYSVAATGQKKEQPRLADQRNSILMSLLSRMKARGMEKSGFQMRVELEIEHLVDGKRYPLERANIKVKLQPQQRARVIRSVLSAVLADETMHGLTATEVGAWKLVEGNNLEIEATLGCAVADETGFLLREFPDLVVDCSSDSKAQACLRSCRLPEGIPAVAAFPGVHEPLPLELNLKRDESGLYSAVFSAPIEALSELKNSGGFESLVQLVNKGFAVRMAPSGDIGKETGASWASTYYKPGNSKGHESTAGRSRSKAEKTHPEGSDLIVGFLGGWGSPRLPEKLFGDIYVESLKTVFAKFEETATKIEHDGRLAKHVGWVMKQHADQLKFLTSALCSQERRKSALCKRVRGLKGLAKKIAKRAKREAIREHQAQLREERAERRRQAAEERTARRQAAGARVLCMKQCRFPTLMDGHNEWRCSVRHPTARGGGINCSLSDRSCPCGRMSKAYCRDECK